jgi:Rieske Fe-S protein
MDRKDAWNVYPDEPIGGIYLRRTSASEPPQAFSATCPHLGCYVDYEANRGHFHCPCHDSSFEVDGKRILPEPPKVCPSARDMDSLELEVRNGSEIWVKYERFHAVLKEKIAEA